MPYYWQQGQPENLFFRLRRRILCTRKTTGRGRSKIATSSTSRPGLPGGGKQRGGACRQEDIVTYCYICHVFFPQLIGC